MTNLTLITLENEMDLILAYKKSIRTAEHLGLTISTQTSFATAVSEVCREVIDKAYEGKAVLGTLLDNGRFFYVAHITCRIEDDFDRGSAGFEYARKLVPVLETRYDGDQLEVTLKLGIPRSTRLDARRVQQVKQQIEQEGPSSAYEEVKQKNEQLQHLNQQHELALMHAEYLNQQKNEFLSVASHELNSPLTILRSYAQIANKFDDGHNEALSKCIKKIDVQSAKLVALIQQLLDISKIENGQIDYKLEITDTNEFISNSLESLKLLIPSHQLNVELGDSASLMIDRIRTEQVLNNLLVNAAKYSSPGSNITVRSSLSKNLMTIYVEDEGIGMSDQTVDNIFNKFYRSENVIQKYSGLGMGLYIASRIIADHKGTINVSSTEGKGSVFSFTLPVVAQVA